MNNLAKYNDLSLNKLKNELKELKNELKDLILKKSKYINLMDDFNNRYNSNLGDLIIEILLLKQSLLKKEIELSNTIDKRRKEEDFNYYKKEYESFSHTFEKSIETENILNDEELKELKKLYRNAVKICHPDIVNDKFKDKAHKIITQLNDAYSNKDLLKVKEIYKSLCEKNIFSDEPELTTIQRLQSEINLLKIKIKKIKSEIKSLESERDFKLIISIDDWNEYFNNIRKELIEEKKNLEMELESIKA